MSSRTTRRFPAARAALSTVLLGLAGIAAAVQPGTYQGYTAAGLPVTIVVALHHGRPFVEIYDYAAIVTCSLSGSQYQWEQEVIGGGHIAADGGFTMAATVWDVHTRMTGRFDEAGHVVGTAFQQDPMLTLEDPQRAEFCADGPQHFAAKWVAAAPAAAARTAMTSDVRTTMRLDAAGRVVSREVTRRPAAASTSSSPARAASPMTAASGVAPGHYAGTNSQGHPMSFDVQPAASGLSMVVVNYQDSEDMVCATTGQTAYSTGFVRTAEPVSAIGSFAFTDANLFSHYDVTGSAQPDGSIAGTTREAVSGLTNAKPQASELCQATGPLSWTATLVGGARVGGR